MHTPGETKRGVRQTTAEMKQIIRNAEQFIRSNSWDAAVESLREVEGLASALAAIAEHEAHADTGCPAYCDYLYETRESRNRKALQDAGYIY